MSDALRARWSTLATRWGGSEPVAFAVFDDIATRYAEPRRRYHTLRHVQAVLDTIDGLIEAEPVDDPAAVRLAGWFHDVVYDPCRSDNEEASAVVARNALARIGAPDAVVTETVRLIELTATHRVQANDGNARVLIDADLAILGAEPADYDGYADAIRAEYAHIDDHTFRVGRRDVLRRFLDRPRLFATDEAHRRLDAAARANIRRELRALGA